MLIRVGFEIGFELPAETPFMALLHTHPEVQPALRRSDILQTDPPLPIREFIDGFGNRCVRFLAPAGHLMLRGDTVVEDDGLPSPVSPGAMQRAVQDLPDACLPFLLPSRYCEVDRMSDLAWKLFGDTPPGWARMQAICDWVHTHVRFDYMEARPTKTAFDVYEERTGVCRDFQHLAITFCRCLNIPARYATGWLGDHGIVPVPGPMDFSAWFEVYLGDRWWICDARFNTPRIGHVLMARGRDAADCALTTSFGTSILGKFEVWSDQVEEI